MTDAITLGHAVAPQLKLNRAQAHIDEASVLVEDWLAGDAFTIEPVTDHSTGRTEERVRLREQPPDELAVVIGDAVHNLRVALDHAVYDAASRAAGGELSPKQERALMFPIHETRRAYEKNAPNRLEGVPKPVKHVIEDAQPFRSAPPGHPSAYRVQPLWQLNELDVIDKHRRLTVTAASLRFQAIGVPEDVDPKTVFSFGQGQVHDGQVLVSYVGKAEGVEHLAERDLALAEPAIRPTIESKIVVARSVMDVLVSLQKHVMDVVQRMEFAERTRRDV